MLDPVTLSWAVPAGAKFIGGLLNRKKASRPTEMINYYDRIQKEGAYSPAARRAIMGNAGSEMGNVQSQATADLRGNLANRGMLNSIAGIRTLAMPGMERMRSMGNMARDITAKNEMSKVGAGEKLASLLSGYNADKQAAREANRANLIGGITGAAESAVGGWAQAQENNELASFDKMHAGVQAYITGNGDLSSPEFAQMFEQAYGIKWPGKMRSMATSGATGVPGVTGAYKPAYTPGVGPSGDELPLVMLGGAPRRAPARSVAQSDFYSGVRRGYRR